MTEIIPPITFQVNDSVTYEDVPLKIDGNPIIAENSFAVLNKTFHDLQELAKAINILLEYYQKSAKIDDIKFIEEQIKQLAKKEDLSSIWKSCENLFAKKQVEQQIVEIAKKTDSIAPLIKMVTEYADKTKEVCQNMQTLCSTYGVTSNDLQAQINLLANNFVHKEDIDIIVRNLNGLVSMVAGDRIYTQNIEITSSELLDLKDTPKVVLTPSSSEFIMLTCVKIAYTYNTTAYTITNPSDMLSVQYETSGKIVDIDPTGLIDQVVDTSKAAYGITWNGSCPIGESVILKTLNNDYTLGDGTLTLTLKYKII